MEKEELIQKILSLKTQEEKVQYLKAFCFKRIFEITGDKELVEKLGLKNIDIEILSSDEIKKLYAELGGEGDGTRAFYSRKQRKVFTSEINSEEAVIDFVHEFLHALSHFYGNENKPEKIGIRLPFSHENSAKSNHFNEGMNVKAVSMVLGYDAGNTYGANKKKLEIVQAMCGLSDKEIFRLNFEDDGILVPEAKDNFNPKDSNALEDILSKYIQLEEIEDFEKYVENCSEKTKTLAKKLIQTRKEEEKKKREEPPSDGWDMI